MTIYEEFQKKAKASQKHKAVSWKENTEWQFFTYKEFLERIDNLAIGLTELGLSPGDRVAILSENRPEWSISDLALNKIRAISVPIHTTSKLPSIEYILRDSESKYLIISKKLFKEEYLEKFDLEKIILISKEKNSQTNNDKIILFSDLMQTNKQTFNKEEVELNSNQNDNEENLGDEPSTTLHFAQDPGTEKEKNNLGDLASIIYTSGTTGEPKGVMLSNANFLSNILAVKKAIRVFPEDRFLSFLPLSHVLERTAGNYVPLFSGALIYYNTDIKELSDNLLYCQPSILISVPKIFERIYEKIFAQINKKGGLSKKLFFWSLRSRKSYLEHRIADLIVHRKIRRAFGGRLRFAVSGGASINERILKFFSKMKINIIEGYGLTETSPIISCNTLEENKIGTVGKPMDCLEVKIADDKEILMRGPSLMQGYWNKDNLTEEAIQDTWFHTGDLGFLDSDSYLSIIGRKKDIIVTSNGKNVAPEKIEGMLNLSPYIDQALVVGHKQSYLVALFTLDCEKNIDGVCDLDLDAQTNIIKKEVEKINRDLESYEKIRRFKILEKSFTIEDGELTPTLKVRRKIIEEKYSDVIEGMYG